MLKAFLSRVRSDVAVGLLAVVVLMTWPEQIMRFVLDLAGVP